MMRSLVLAGVIGLVACGGSSNNGNNNGPDAGSNSGSNMGSNGSNTMLGSASGTPGNGMVPYAVPLVAPFGPAVFYTSTLSVGSQMFAMDLDTGSTTTAIAGMACTDCSGSDYTISPAYMPGAGATDQGVKADSEFGDGTGWYGEVYMDKIDSGHGSPTATLKIVDISTQVDPNDPMAMSGFFEDNSYQGILGLGATANEVDNTDSYYDTIVGTGMPNIMGFELCADSGTMWLGGFDATHASGAMQYTPLDPISPFNPNTGTGNPFYSIDLTGVSFNGKAIAATSPADLQEWVVDTGTSAFFVPTEFYNGVTSALIKTTAYKTFFGTQDITTSQTGCVTASSTVTDDQINAMLPTFVMTMKNAAGGADITVTAPALDSYLVDAGPDPQQTGKTDFCLTMGDGGQEATMGDAVMQGFVVAIDVKNSQVGWAPDSGCASAMPRPHDVTARMHPPKPHHGPRRVIH